MNSYTKFKQRILQLSRKYVPHTKTDQRPTSQHTPARHSDLQAERTISPIQKLNKNGVR